MQARAPAPRVVLNPEDALALGLAPGARILVEGTVHPAPLTVDPAMPRGHIGLSIGPASPRGARRRIDVKAVQA